MTFVVAVLLVLALAYPAQYADAYMIPAPHDSSKNNSLDLSAIVQQIEILKESLPVPQIALHVDEPKNISVGSELPLYMQIGWGVVAVAEMLDVLLDAPRTPAVHIVYAKDFLPQENNNPISNTLTAAALHAGGYIQNIPAPDFGFEPKPAASQLFTYRNFFEGTVAVNEALAAFNEVMFSAYRDAALNFVAAAAFDAQAAAHIWDNTFAAFGERFVSDVYAFGAAQTQFYVQSAAAIESGYGQVADEIEKDSTLNASISVASIAYAPSLTEVVGESVLAKWWGGAVDFVANLFVASSETVAEKFASESSL